MRRRARTPEELAARHAQRHRSRSGTVYRRFLSRLHDVTGLSAMQAENAAVAVLHVLEQRMIADEGKHLEAQLPSRLRELLQQSPPREHLPARKIDREAFLMMVAAEVGEERAEEVVRAVFQVLSEQVSAGEIVNVVHQLPRDLRGLWPEAVQQATRSREELDQARADEKEASGVEIRVEPRRERRAIDDLRDRLVALPLTDQLELFRAFSAAFLRELDASERLELLRELHEQVREVGREENAFSPEP